MELQSGSTDVPEVGQYFRCETSGVEGAASLARDHLQQVGLFRPIDDVTLLWQGTVTMHEDLTANEKKNLVLEKTIGAFPKTVADPGFPRGGGANSPGVPTYDFAKFSRKLHEIEII